MDGLPINLSTDVHSVYATINVKSYQSRTKGALRREHGERSTYPVSLGVGLGGPETSVTLARQALALGMWPKMSQASCGVWREDSGLLSRPYSKRRPSSREDWGVSWVF